MREHFRVGSYRQFNRSRFHHVVGEITPDGEFKEAGMPFFESTTKGESYARRIAERMSELSGKSYISKELVRGARYLRRIVISDRQIIHRVAFHGIDDGKHNSADSTKNITPQEPRTRQNQLD